MGPPHVPIANPLGLDEFPKYNSTRNVLIGFVTQKFWHERET